jgi:hypothetical protein
MTSVSKGIPFQLLTYYRAQILLDIEIFRITHLHICLIRCLANQRAYEYNFQNFA